MDCRCQSNRPFEQCHAEAAEAWEPVAAEVYRYRLPDHVPDRDADALAAELDPFSPYDIKRDRRFWLLTPRPPTPAFAHVPALRHSTAELRAVLMRDAFDQISNWPPGPYRLPEERQAALKQILSSTRTTTADQLFEWRQATAAALNHPTVDSLRAELPAIAAAITTAFSHGTMDVLQIYSRTLSASPIARILAMLPHFTVDQLHAIYGPSSDQHGSAYYSFDPAPYFELLANVNYPLVSAFGIRYGLEAHVMIDYGRALHLQPLDWQERRARDIGGRVMLTPRSDAFTTRALDKFDLPDRHFLRAWLSRRLNYLFFHLSHLACADRDPNGCVLTMRMWKDMLTVEDIVGLTQLAATTADTAMQRLLFFDLMDRYSQLGGRPRRTIDSLLCDAFVQRAADALDGTLLDMQQPIRALLLDAWGRVSRGLWSGVLDPAVRAAGSIDVSLQGEPPDFLARDAFVSRVLRAIRNTTHGYNLERQEFERYLARHKGVVPDGVRELSIGLWFAFMSRPAIFWPANPQFAALKPRVFRPAEPARSLPAQPPRLE